MDEKKDCLHHPYKLRKDFKVLVDRVVSYIEQGYRVKQACLLAGITHDEYYGWKRYKEEEINEGYTNTPVINFWNHVDRAFAGAEGPLIKALRNAAIDGNTKSAMYLLDSAYGWKNNKQEVEISASEDTGIEINIIGMDNPYEEEGDD